MNPNVYRDQNASPWLRQGDLLIKLDLSASYSRSNAGDRHIVREILAGICKGDHEPLEANFDVRPCQTGPRRVRSFRTHEGRA